MSPRRKSVDSGRSSGDESDGHKFKDKHKKEKKDKKDKDKHGKDKDKEKKDKDKFKDGKDKTKDGHNVADGSAGQSFAPMPPSYGQWSSPPIVPPSFEANRAAAPGFPSAPSFPNTAPSFPTSPSSQSHNAAPPSGYRVPLITTSQFPDAVVAGQPPCYDGDGVTPIFIGSALFGNSVHPCKIGPHLQPFVSVAYGGVEYAHHGRFDLLPFVPQTMEWVRSSFGQIPPGRRPIEGGYEEDGAKLYHGLALVNGVRVPGKTGEHLGACNVSFGGAEVAVTDHEILCWR